MRDKGQRHRGRPLMPAALEPSERGSNFKRVSNRTMSAAQDSLQGLTGGSDFVDDRSARQARRARLRDSLVDDSRPKPRRPRSSSGSRRYPLRGVQPIEVKEIEKPKLRRHTRARRDENETAGRGRRRRVEDDDDDDEHVDHDNAKRRLRPRRRVLQELDIEEQRPKRRLRPRAIPRRRQDEDDEEEEFDDENEEEEEAYEIEDHEEEEEQGDQIAVTRRLRPRAGRLSSANQPYPLRGRKEEGGRYPKRNRRERDDAAASNAVTADRYLAMAKEDDEFFDYYYAVDKDREDDESDVAGASLYGGSTRKRRREAESVAYVETTAVEQAGAAFEGVAGLEAQRAALEEMVLVPLRHPGVFQKLGVCPPRGVLFYGPPGCGKTALARELARACGQAVSFFARKGGDLLSKYVGEAERALKLLFEEARSKAPSIVFFDELDGLAPCRSRTMGDDGNHQDSVVATLLALMDGLEDRGDVVVIGSTNRPEAIDPALRRPGRFDRELEFAPPELDDRAAILALHTKRWATPPSARLVRDIARRAKGFCGADLKALATEAALVALRRHRPDLFRQRTSRFKPLAGDVVVRAQDFDLALHAVSPNSRRANVKSINHGGLVAAPLEDRLAALYGKYVTQAGLELNAAPVTLFDNDDSDDENGAVSTACGAARQAARARASTSRPRRSSCAVLIEADDSDLQAAVRLVASAVLYDATARVGTEYVDVGLGALLREQRRQRSLEAALADRVSEARAMADTCGAVPLLFIPDADVWWHTAPETVRSAASVLFRETSPLALVATASGDASSFIDFLAELGFQSCRLEIEPPSSSDRLAYFKTVLADVGDAVRAAAEAADEVAATQDQIQDDTWRIEEQQPVAAKKRASKDDPRQRARDEHCLRELRIFFRAALRELRNDRSVTALWRPIDPDECPEFYQVAEDPIDLSVIRARVDAQSYYPTLDAFLADIDTVRTNARALADVMPGDARADDNAHAAANAHDLVLSMAHCFERKLGWDLVKRCQEIHDRRTRQDDDDRDDDQEVPQLDLLGTARAVVQAAIAADQRAARSARCDARINAALPKLLERAGPLAAKSTLLASHTGIDDITDQIWRAAERYLTADDPLGNVPRLADALAQLAEQDRVFET